MCNHYADEPQHWRLERTKTIKRILSPKSIKKLGWKEAEEVVNCLHCLLAINRARFLNSKNNNIDDIKECWIKLLHSGKIDSSKIEYVNGKLMFFGLSSIYELIGWYYPEKYPLMNGNSDCGMRFFGYTI